jgi:transcription elongation factor Elf1
MVKRRDKMQEEKQVETTIQEKVVVIYVVAKCPHCGAIFTDYIYMNAQVGDGCIECPICNRAIIPGGMDEGEDFE